MKHAISILENALEDIQRNEPIIRAENRSSIRLAKAMKWDLLEAIQLIRRHSSERKAANRKGGQS